MVCDRSRRFLGLGGSSAIAGPADNPAAYAWPTARSSTHGAFHGVGAWLFLIFHAASFSR
ncbi:hypothetical protein WFL04_21545 [Yersinia enterocolitica]